MRIDDNARLAIMTQHGMVNCLKELIAVLGVGLSSQRRSDLYVRTTVPANLGDQNSTNNLGNNTSTPDAATTSSAPHFFDVVPE